MTITPIQKPPLVPCLTSRIDNLTGQGYVIKKISLSSIAKPFVEEETRLACYVEIKFADKWELYDSSTTQRCSEIINDHFRKVARSLRGAYAEVESDVSVQVCRELPGQDPEILMYDVHQKTKGYITPSNSAERFFFAST